MTPRAGLYAAALAIIGFAGLAILILSRAATSGFSGADESAHFVNALTVGDYASTALGRNPIAFAADLYLHYPKVSIGHWPPFFYGVLGSIFVLTGPSIMVALGFSWLVAAAAALVVTHGTARLAGRHVALCATLVMAMTPIWLESLAFLMLDQALALLCGLAALAWHRHAVTRGWLPLAGFALSCIAAVLTKGNGWLLGFVPILHAALTGRGRILFGWRTILAAALVLATAAPWYWLSAGIASDGFNYEPGIDYAVKSGIANIGFLTANVTPVGLLLALFGIAIEHRARREDPERWSLVATWISLLIATLLIQALVPADITDRYMAPALIPLVILAMTGAWRLAGMLPPRLAPWTVPVATLLCMAPGGLHLAQRVPKVGYRLDRVAAGIARTDRPAIWLIDGSAGAEGAMIAEAALRDPAHRLYIARGSKILSSSDFMGRKHVAFFHDSAALLGALDRLGVQGIVTVRPGGQDPLPDSVQLARALADPASPYRPYLSVPFANRAGTTIVYRRPDRVIPDIAALSAVAAPAKARAFTRPR